MGCSFILTWLETAQCSCDEVQNSSQFIHDEFSRSSKPFFTSHSKHHLKLHNSLLHWITMHPATQDYTTITFIIFCRYCKTLN